MDYLVSSWRDMYVCIYLRTPVDDGKLFRGCVFDKITKHGEGSTQDQGLVLVALRKGHDGGNVRLGPKVSAVYCRQRSAEDQRTGDRNDAFK